MEIVSCKEGVQMMMSMMSGSKLYLNSTLLNICLSISPVVS